MSSLILLAWIAGAVILQLLIYLSLSFWRHWLDYQQLRVQGPEVSVLPAQPEPGGSANPAWSGLRNFRVARKTLEDASGSVCSVYLTPEDRQPLPPFLPGQFLTFRFEMAGPSGSVDSVVRCYSLSDAPNPDAYRISVKRASAPAGTQAPAGRCSSFVHDQLAVGQVVQVRAPSGHFYLKPGTSPVVLIAGGVGITPMLSMLNWSLKEEAGREVWLFYGVRHGGELVQKEHLQTLAALHPGFHLRFCFSAPQPGDMEGPHCCQSRVDVQLLRQELSLKPYHFYLCGPTPMLETLVPALEDWGVADAHIHFEAFGPASIKRKTTSPEPAALPTQADDIQVTFAKSGKQLVWQASAGNLLDFAEANGISVDSGCRAGGCGSCQTTILSGQVAYHQVPDHDPEPGSCLLCVSSPKTSLSLDA